MLSLASIYFSEYKKNILFDGVGFLALIVLLLCLYFYDGYVSFPGLNAALPTLATLVVIWAGSYRGLVYRLLSISPARFFGNISYSLYLWHWPVIVFYKLIISYSITKTDQVVLLFVSTVLGYLSYRWVEIPFKNIQFQKNSYKPIAFSFGVSALACLVAIWMLSGLGYRFSN